MPRLRLFLLESARNWLRSYAEVRERTEKPEDVEQPENNDDDDNAVEDRLDGALHRNEAVDEPKQNADDDQYDDDVDEGHRTSLHGTNWPQGKIDGRGRGSYTGNGGVGEEGWV